MESTSTNNNNTVDDIKPTTTKTTSTKIRKVLTLSERLKLINDIEVNGLSRQDVAQKYNIAKTAVYTTIRLKSFWKEQLLRTHDGRIKRIKKLKYEKIDKAMNIFISQRRNCSNVPISGALLKKQALSYAAHFGYSDFRASNGWLDRLKIRHNLNKNKGFNEELMSDKTNTIQPMHPILKECALITCNSKESFDENNEINFFRFPHNPRQMRKWVIALKDKPLRIKSKEELHLCSKHFVLNEDKQLKKNAIPSVFEDDDTKLKTKRKKRVKCKVEMYNLQRICRSCLKNPKPTEKMIPVFDGTNIGIGSKMEAISIYEELTLLNLKVFADDGLPQQICNGCLEFLKMLNTFRTLSKKAQFALEQYVHNRSPPRTFETIWIENDVEAGNKASWPLKKRKVASTSDCNFDNYPNVQNVYDIGGVVVPDKKVPDVECNDVKCENDNVPIQIKITELLDSEKTKKLDEVDKTVNDSKNNMDNMDAISDKLDVDMDLINHKSNKWPCKFCGNHFVSSDHGIKSYQNPSEKCTLNKELKCMYCDEIFYNDIEKYVKHINTFHPYGLVCWICNESTVDRYKLANHIASHSVNEFTAGI